MKKILLIVLLGVFFISFANASWCYQESANISNQSGTDGDCSLSYTGNYSFNDNFSDGDWDTSLDAGAIIKSINYTKPPFSISALWQIKYQPAYYGIYFANYTLPTACFNQEFLILRYRYNPDASTYYGSLKFECYDGLSWVVVTSHGNRKSWGIGNLWEEAIFWDIDLTGPVITLPFYANLSQKYNVSTLPINIRLDDAGIGLINSSCLVNINGTNQTFPVADNWCNGSIWLTGLADGDYPINIWANDTYNNTAFNESYFVQIISTKPAITIISPVGVQTTTNVSFNFSIDTIDTLDYCSYNVTTQPGVIVVPENSINCSNLLEYQQIGDTGGVNYIVNVFGNDSLGNFNTFSTYFSVSLVVPISSVGGGGGTIIEKLEIIPSDFCKGTEPIFKTYWKAWVNDLSWINFKLMWFALWNHSFCVSSASLVPLTG